MPMLPEDVTERWKALWEDASTDQKWVQWEKERDDRRAVIRREIADLLSRFLGGSVSTEELRATLDQKTRREWDLFGLKGMSGAMFLNMLVKHIPDQDALAGKLREVIQAPPDAGAGRKALREFVDYLEGLIQAGQVSRRQLQPARAPFLISSLWHMQKPDQWTPFYQKDRQALSQGGLYRPTNDPVEDYMIYRETFVSLASAMGISWSELEHLLGRLADQGEAQALPVQVQPKGAAKTETAQPGSAASEPEVAPLEDAGAATGTSHTQVQWTLASIGSKLGCKVWIAQNDRSRTWNGEVLGSLSIGELPSLGLGEESQRIIRLIDVLWLRGNNQVVAAFEVEHTTSIYSGLLRLSDLAVLSPNLNFPLYIVSPEARVEQVKRELTRPTFQLIELHRRCGFFTTEELLREADYILRYATDPSAIDRLASRVGDVSEE